MGLMMKNVKMLALATAAVVAMSASAFAAEQTGDIHKGDYKWVQFNAMYSVDEHPIAAGTDAKHDYLEMEFGGRSGFVDLYGYVDVFNVSKADSGDKTGDASKIFMKFAPRFSIDAITGKDLSFGPVKEVYFSTLFNWGGGAVQQNGSGDVNMSFWGVGADVEVPWLGKTGMNLFGTYDINAKEWNGYQFSANWFKPFKFFDNGSFLSFQGYIDWQFAMDEKVAGTNVDGLYNRTDAGGAAFFGLYWHSDRFALGYGAKYYDNVYGLNDRAFSNQFWDGLNTTGWGHYVAATYKF
jgi:nucleoside-specific channel-forming protein